MAPYGCGTLAHPKVCPCLSKQMRTGRRGDHIAMRGRFCARARTANRSSGAPCCRNQPRPNVPDNPIILVAAKAKVSLGSKLPAGSCSADHFALLTELASYPTVQGRTKRRFPGCLGTVSRFCCHPSPVAECPGISDTEQASAVLNRKYHLH